MIPPMKPLCTILTLVLLASISLAAPAPTNTPTSVQVYFSPNGGGTDAIVGEINKAKAEILVQAYSFTSKEIAKALIDAHLRCIKVQVILDKSNLTEKYSAADFVAHAGIPILIDSEHAIAHNKVMVIDAETVITGSFNFTKAAEEHNAENLLILHDKTLAAKYTANWQDHATHSKPYSRQ